jgi:hypothetical protein
VEEAKTLSKSVAKLDQLRFVAAPPPEVSMLAALAASESSSASPVAWAEPLVRQVSP